MHAAENSNFPCKNMHIDITVMVCCMHPKKQQNGYTKNTAHHNCYITQR